MCIRDRQNDLRKLADSYRKVVRLLALIGLPPVSYTHLVAYGLERVKLFSWEETARQLLALYESLGR